jgi:hypothetical protein
MKQFNNLPETVQAKVKEILRAYRKCYVVYEYGEYHVSAGIALKAKYAPDHEFIGEYRDTEIYTDAERVINYVESFHDYPIEYRGKRDYRMINALTWSDKVKFDDNGNIVRA